MVRARATGRGARRGAAAPSGGRPSTEGNEAADNAGPSNDPATTTPATLDEAVASSSSTTRAPARRGGTTAGTRTTTGGRLRPKILRRDEADRDKLARQEEQKANERAAAERRARGRSRNRSKRSRGDAMGARGGRGTSTASGPFSGGFAGAAGSRGGGWFGGGSGVTGGGFHGGRGKFESKGKGFGEADIRMREARINADKLHVMSPEDELDSDDEAMMAALNGRTASTMPMGIYRREHKEQGVVVATTAELEAAENATGEEESLWVDGEGPGSLTPSDQPEEGVLGTDGNPVLIKKEPDIEDPMDLDSAIKAAPADEDKKKAVLATKPKKELPKDPEERAIQTDLDLLAGELGAVTVTDEAGEAQTEGPSNKDGRLYLFQFPPLIPPLKEVARPHRRTTVKEEGKAFNVMDAPSASDAAVDLTQDDSNRNSHAEDNREEEEPETEGFRSQFLSHGGMIGKLNVRKSGKVELDWGGMNLEMSPAAGMNFLTTAIIVEENDEKPQQGVVGGDSVGMGKIMGRFVLAPIWSEEEDWNVAPEELVVE
ncbi:DNA-directed RNA polymerase III RPC4 [Pochonia chlamydosporia 170]|uniref:DNA-directed RNA polymerase III RPC4 n=1 Tax=Pochonia chlamydosporia 170 TaxID=1380566 RepID=A0A179FD63_METCM|nr:DNA-directed RNA polymerase III RPC4 [Pochonia chlamydosporia 170]OAQ63426.1 DNA-directed RNA polymerase III RPC4 [Pochonia chlamydosporia 170]